ncbi:MAG: aldo/keto reductase [Pseudomonadota bacterium]|nr:aldo/keto reductase [Pseudomonadota bacterium]MEC7960787.1 aldo/keto reductase [Pseudomonadota bacterium]MEC8007652.1 aldo/keto reductase [Pseudomonadota bacterium]MEC8438983.1 aldo/keto reductase [Pseudomonadota bacterium]MEC8468200.1 aldo/keto reductase [Pseudomonadota bacterium]
MERIELAQGLSFSRLVYGMWRLADDSDTSVKHVDAKINAALDQGITTFDQADIYGGYTAEAVMGAAMRANPSLRQRMEIVSKCDIVIDAGRHSGARVKHYNTTAAHINASVDASLAEMGIDEIDVLLVHRPDPFMDHHETGAALDALVDAGKVRAAGVSNFRPWDWSLLQSAMRHPLVTNQIELSLKHIAPFTNGDLAFHQQHGHVVMAWSPLGGGDLMTASNELTHRLDSIAKRSGVDRAAVATAFLLAHPAKITPVLGTNNLDRISSISAAETVQLDRQDWFSLYEAALGSEVP